MVSDNSKPLYSHTKLDYWECYAKIVLEDLFSDRFCNLILADKPDLQDVNGVVGIEVTRADKQDQIEIERLYSGLFYKEQNQIARDIERIEQLGAKVFPGFLAGIKLVDDFSQINKAIDAKCKKIAKGEYKKFETYQLFLFSSIYAVDDMLNEELQHLISNDIGKFYHVIYILVPGCMYCFDLKLGNYKTFDIDSKKQFEHVTKARRIVLEGEEDAKRI
jgi:hypothetical protein